MMKPLKCPKCGADMDEADSKSECPACGYKMRRLTGEEIARIPEPVLDDLRRRFPDAFPPSDEES